MRSLPLIVLSTFFCYSIFGQISNLKQGTWSDHTVWSNNLDPVSTDDIILNFDVTVDKNSFCKSLNTNGHKVTIIAGVNLSIGGSAAIDTATLLKIISVNYSNGVPSDSTARLIKNAYANGRRKIIVSQIDLPESTDTFYTAFNYNNQNQLINISYYENDAAAGVYNENITWQNNKVIKIVSDEAGTPYRTDDFTYTPNGPFTNITIKTSPPLSQDTTYSGNEIQYIFSYKYYLSVDAKFAGVSKKNFSHYYYLNGPGTGIPGNYYDTTDFNYAYNTNGNVSGTTIYHSAADTNVWNFPLIRQYKDTSGYAYSRNSTEDPAIYELLKTVYGNDLLTLINFMDLDFGWADVLGDGQSYYNNFPYQKQTLNSVLYNSVYWMNGMPDPSKYPAVNAITFKADNFFDFKNRLVRSVEYDGSGSGIKSVTQIIYP
ncbi:MAG: hypothetical protein ABIQ31_01525 [Ferruginibacter sp.]